MAPLLADPFGLRSKVVNPCFIWHFIGDEPICRPSRVMEGCSIVVFGLIGVDGLLSIRKIEEIVNGEKYAQLMDKDIILMLKARYKSKFIFQDD